MIVPSISCAREGRHVMVKAPEATDGDDLLALVRAGDEQGKNRFYGRYHDYLWLVLLKWANERLPVHDLPEGEIEGVVEDAISDAIVYAIRNIDNYNPERANIRTWLVEMAWSALRRLFRRTRAEALARRKRLRPTDEAQMVADPSPGPEQALLQEERRQQVFAVLGALRPRHRQALLLVDYYSYPLSAVRRALDLPSYEAASSLVRRARTAFKRRWRERKK